MDKIASARLVGGFGRIKQARMTHMTHWHLPEEIKSQTSQPVVWGSEGVQRGCRSLQKSTLPQVRTLWQSFQAPLQAT